MLNLHIYDVMCSEIILKINTLVVEIITGKDSCKVSIVY